MSINASCVAAVAVELSELLIGGRIDRIQQPSSELILLTVRSRGVNRRLLLSSSSNARVHITEAEFENPAEPPMFCMLLRKHLLGSEIRSIEQPGGDRILAFHLTNFDEIGRSSGKTLYIEMIPGKVNIILVGSDGIIIDCIRRRDYEPDHYRRIFPGMIYRAPRRPENYVTESAVSGSDHGNHPAFISKDFESVSSFLDAYYSEREKKELYFRKTKELRTALTSAKKRIEKKLSSQRIELAATADRDMIRRRADLIIGNIFRIKKGDTILVCEDYYDESYPEVKIPLDPLLSPQENAAKLYKIYSRMKTAEAYLIQLIDKAEQQLDYIDSTFEELSRAGSEAEIDGIRDELLISGIIRSHFSRNGSQRKSSKKKHPLDYYRRMTSTGLEILAGKNNIQNDELTFSVAAKTDLWFHVKDYHGSHVILRTLGTTVSELDLLEAAQTAAEYSQAASGGAAGFGGKISVDYTEVRFVKKRSGALPGKVTYVNQHTLIIPFNS